MISKLSAPKWALLKRSVFKINASFVPVLLQCKQSKSWLAHKACPAVWHAVGSCSFQLGQGRAIISSAMPSTHVCTDNDHVSMI